jgi:hypothetical protein
MALFDSETATEADSELVRGFRGAVRFGEQYALPLKVAAVFAFTTALGLGWHSVATQQFGNNMSAILVWFSVVFATFGGVLGGIIKISAAVQKRRHGWE